MKRKILPVLILIICIIMSCCAKSEATVRTTPESTTCATGGPITDIDKSCAIWLNLERAEDFHRAAKEVDLGKVILSPALSNAMQDYPSDTVLAVAVCFAAMVSEHKLANPSPAEKEAYIDELFEKASGCCNDAGILVRFPHGTCSEYTFFYAYGTRSQIENLTCNDDVALYVAATWQYK